MSDMARNNESPTTSAFPEYSAQGVYYGFDMVHERSFRLPVKPPYRRRKRRLAKKLPGLITVYRHGSSSIKLLSDHDIEAIRSEMISLSKGIEMK